MPINQSAKKVGIKMARKVYVSVLVWYDTTGKGKPYRIRFEDDPVYKDEVWKIDRIKDVRRAASTRVGGTGMRYTIMINGKELYLFEDENRWFIEAKDYYCQF